ncbi:MAG: hypothetical protein E7347_02910 [Clostridiales bacterium]|nr:hypothetical protein [Clostridiales bacterium]
MDISQLPFNPRSKVKFILKNGKEVEIKTLFSPQDFLTEYKKRDKMMRLFVGNNSFAVINKTSVEFFQVEEP